MFFEYIYGWVVIVGIDKFIRIGFDKVCFCLFGIVIDKVLCYVDCFVDFVVLVLMCVVMYKFCLFVLVVYF